ncbi:hypothetical protein Rhom172_0338 [Rhodothermus marinus SG0.5JP17-172]|nr:hypothetical protein Rhom172_0338 [Rhodothermus marinus SG0.5JP17-172]
MLLLLITLVLGVGLGMLLHAQLVRHRWERLVVLRSPQGFMHRLEEAIGPVDETQRQQIQAILARGSARMARHMAQVRRETRALLDSLRAELDAVLTPEQRIRLERFLEEMRRFPPPRRRQGDDSLPPLPPPPFPMDRPPPR